MFTIERKRGSFNDLVFTIDLSNYNRTISEIEDILFIVKANAGDADNNAVFSKRQSANEIVFAAPNIVSVEWNTDEYDNFEIETLYWAGLFLKFNGDPSFDENVQNIFSLKIIQDFVEE